MFAIKALYTVWTLAIEEFLKQEAEGVMG